jgi:hypothetical protein
MFQIIREIPLMLANTRRYRASSPVFAVLLLSCLGNAVASFGCCRVGSSANDNPFSEAQFKTLRYRPDFPARFGSIRDVRAHCHIFFPWYNVARHHGSLGLLTPHDVHYGLAEQGVVARPAVLARPMPHSRSASRAASHSRRRAPRPCGSTPRNPQQPRGDSRARGNSRRRP